MSEGTDPISERLEQLEDRISDLEDESRPSEGEGERALRLAWAELLKSTSLGSVMAQLAKFPEQWLELKEKDLLHQKEITLKTYYSGLIFSGVIFVGVSVLAWFEKIPKEVTAGLMGSLIGYWYGRERSK